MRKIWLAGKKYSIYLKFSYIFRVHSLEQINIATIEQNITLEQKCPSTSTGTFGRC
jgi:hypothetical protein